MTDISVSLLKNQLHRVLGRVETGEEVVITSRGKAIARIVPVQDKREQAQKQLQLLRKTCRLGDITSPIGVDWEATDAPS